MNCVYEGFTAAPLTQAVSDASHSAAALTSVHNKSVTLLTENRPEESVRLVSAFNSNNGKSPLLQLVAICDPFLFLCTQDNRNRNKQPAADVVDFCCTSAT